MCALRVIGLQSHFGGDIFNDNVDRCLGFCAVENACRMHPLTNSILIRRIIKHSSLRQRGLDLLHVPC